MVVTRNTAMDCLRRATLPEQTFVGWRKNLKHAPNSLNLYKRLVDALDKHRGKRQKKITVEHVRFHTVGPAISGSTDASGRMATGTGVGVDERKRLASDTASAEPTCPTPLQKRAPKMSGGHRRNHKALETSPRWGARTPRWTAYGYNWRIQLRSEPRHSTCGPMLMASRPTSHGPASRRTMASSKRSTASSGRNF